MERKIKLNDFDHIIVEDIYNGGIYFRMFSVSQMGKERVFNDGITQRMGITDSRLDSFISDLQDLRDLRDLHRKRLNEEMKDEKPCPECGCHVTRVHGDGFYYDREFCSRCDYEDEYETSSEIHSEK